MAVSEKGDINALCIRDSSGQTFHDEAELMDEMPCTDIRSKLVYVNVDVDIQKLFPPETEELKGQLEEE